MTAGTEVAVRRQQGPMAAIPAKLQYAHELAESGLLPRHYQQRPANILWAMEYGEMLGLAPMAAITGVHVIEGKPTASAGLISALVRRAGHKLRVSGDSQKANCQIVRADDPGYTFEVTFTIEDARAANLTGKDVWKKYASSMLKARAITQCARDACEEALFGLHYTPEELGAEVDEDGVVVAEVVSEPAQQPVVTVDGAGTEDEPWYVHPEPEVVTDPEWVAATLRIIPEIGLEACRKLWPEVVGKVRAGVVAKPDGKKVLDLLTARMETLASPQQDAETPAAPLVADGLDPDDTWALKVEELASEDEAIAALEELVGLVGSGAMEPEHFARVQAAIAVRFPDSASEGQAAA